MLEIWGDKLVQGKLENLTEDNESVTPERLRGRIVLMVSEISHSNYVLSSIVVSSRSSIIRPM